MTCGAYFTLKNDSVKFKNQFIWFVKWIVERQVYKYLSRDSKLSQSSLQRLFKHYLNEAPTIAIRSKNNVHLLIDASYFANDLCLVLYYDYDIRYVQLYRQTNAEKYKEIKEDLENLKRLGVDVYSVTCDGHKAILKAIKKVFPNAIIQRCLVHIKRQTRNNLSTRPKLEQAQQLLKMANNITRINSLEASSFWLLDFKIWYENNRDFIDEKSYQPETKRYWYTHAKLHATCSLIINAIPNMFAYLDDKQIPATTNSIESYFSHLKDKLMLHRGLRFEAKKKFIKWYLYFKNNPNEFF